MMEKNVGWKSSVCDKITVVKWIALFLQLRGCTLENDIGLSNIIMIVLFNGALEFLKFLKSRDLLNLAHQIGSSPRKFKLTTTSIIYNIPVQDTGVARRTLWYID